MPYVVTIGGAYAVCLPNSTFTDLASAMTRAKEIFAGFYANEGLPSPNVLVYDDPRPKPVYLPKGPLVDGYTVDSWRGTRTTGSISDYPTGKEPCQQTPGTSPQQLSLSEFRTALDAETQIRTPGYYGPTEADGGYSVQLDGDTLSVIENDTAVDDGANLPANNVPGDTDPLFEWQYRAVPEGVDAASVPWGGATGPVHTFANLLPGVLYTRQARGNAGDVPPMETGTVAETALSGPLDLNWSRGFRVGYADNLLSAFISGADMPGMFPWTFYPPFFWYEPNYTVYHDGPVPLGIQAIDDQGRTFYPQQHPDETSSLWSHTGTEFVMVGSYEQQWYLNHATWRYSDGTTAEWHYSDSDQQWIDAWASISTRDPVFTLFEFAYNETDYTPDGYDSASGDPSPASLLPSPLRTPGAGVTMGSDNPVWWKQVLYSFTFKYTRTVAGVVETRLSRPLFEWISVRLGRRPVGVSPAQYFPEPPTYETITLAVVPAGKVPANIYADVTRVGALSDGSTLFDRGSRFYRPEGPGDPLVDRAKAAIGFDGVIDYGGESGPTPVLTVPYGITFGAYKDFRMYIGDLAASPPNSVGYLVHSNGTPTSPNPPGTDPYLLYAP